MNNNSNSNNNRYNLVLSIIAGILLVSLIINITQYSFWKDLRMDDNQREVIDFVRGRNIQLAGFDDREISHLLDVKGVITRFNYALLLNIAAASLIMTYLYIKRRDMFSYVLLSSGILSLLLLILGYLYVNSNFEKAFALFHELFFSMNSWIFSSGKLIDIFPKDFFGAAADVIFKKYLFFSLLTTIIGYFVWRCEVAKDKTKRASSHN